MACATAPDSRSGPMELSMKEIGARTKLTARVNSGMQMVMFMRETGRMIKPTVLESICMSMAPGTKVTGATIYRMGMALSRGPMAPATRAATKRE